MQVGWLVHDQLNFWRGYQIWKNQKDETLGGRKLEWKFDLTPGLWHVMLLSVTRKKQP